MLFGVGVKPMEVLLSVPVATSFMILVSGSFHPCIKIVGWFVFVSAVGIAMAVIASMFGTVVNDLMPFVSIAVFLCDLLCYGWSLTLSTDGRLGHSGWCGADGVTGMHVLFQFVDLLSQSVISHSFFLQ